MRITSTSDVTPLAEYLPRVEFFPASDERAAFVSIRINHQGATIAVADPVDAEELISWGVAARDYLSTVNGSALAPHHEDQPICGAKHDGYVCCAARGHSGVHVAWGSESTSQPPFTWPQS